ncbi:MAG: hypothetical protein NXH78_11145 [Hyphomonadaceae bacterium]|nr:hypothetical protein [Hyphomonadaceae bacterium]
MAKATPTFRFQWTAQTQRLAELLSALGHSNRKIAKCLNCSDSTVGRNLGPRENRRQLSTAEWLALFEDYDAHRNVEEVLIAASGSTEQARLRSSYRIRKSKSDGAQPDAANPLKETLSDEQLQRELETLVGQRIRIRRPD